MINKEDYKEMEVLRNGSWEKQDVLKELTDGTCIYLTGNKSYNGSYILGVALSGEACREIKKTELRVKSRTEIFAILIANDYTIDIDGNWVSSDDAEECFVADMWRSCGKEPIGYFDYEPEWLEEVEITED